MNVVLFYFISAQIRKKVIQVSEAGSSSDKTIKNQKQI